MSIELQITPQEKRAQTIRNCGAKPIGERPLTVNGSEELAYFIDPITSTTLILSIADVTELKVMAKLENAWREHGLLMVPGLIDNMRDLITPIETALKFITTGRNLPFEVITAAAHAAIRELLLFEAFPDDSDEVLRRKHFPVPPPPDARLQMSSLDKINFEMPAFLRKIMD